MWVIADALKIDNEPKTSGGQRSPSCSRAASYEGIFLCSHMDVPKITALHATTQLRETYWAMGKGPEVLLGMTSQTKVHSEQDGVYDAKQTS